MTRQENLAISILGEFKPRAQNKHTIKIREETPSLENMKLQIQQIMNDFHKAGNKKIKNNL